MCSTYFVIRSRFLRCRWFSDVGVGFGPVDCGGGSQSNVASRAVEFACTHQPYGWVIAVHSVVGGCGILIDMSGRDGGGIATGILFMSRLALTPSW